MAGFTGDDGWVGEESVRVIPPATPGRSAHSSPPWYAILAALPLPVELLAEAHTARLAPGSGQPTRQGAQAQPVLPSWESVAEAPGWGSVTAAPPGSGDSSLLPGPVHSQPDRSAYPDAAWQAPLVGAPSIRPHRGPPPGGASQAAQYLDADGRLDPPILLPLAEVASAGRELPGGRAVHSPAGWDWREPPLPWVPSVAIAGRESAPGGRQTGDLPQTADPPPVLPIVALASPGAPSPAPGRASASLPDRLSLLGLVGEPAPSAQFARPEPRTGGGAVRGADPGPIVVAVDLALVIEHAGLWDGRAVRPGVTVRGGQTRPADPPFVLPYELQDVSSIQGMLARAVPPATPGRVAGVLSLPTDLVEPSPPVLSQ